MTREKMRTKELTFGKTEVVFKLEFQRLALPIGGDGITLSKRFAFDNHVVNNIVFCNFCAHLRLPPSLPSSSSQNASSHGRREQDSV